MKITGRGGVNGLCLPQFYITMEKANILTVEIDGVEYPAHPSLGAMLLFKKETGREVNQISGISDSIVWLWCCVKSASSKSDKPMTLSCQEFADSCTMEQLTAWNEMQQGNAEESKKKTPKGSRKGSTNS